MVGVVVDMALPGEAVIGVEDVDVEVRKYCLCSCLLDYVCICCVNVFVHFVSVWKCLCE